MVVGGGGRLVLSMGGVGLRGFALWQMDNIWSVVDAEGSHSGDCGLSFLFASIFLSVRPLVQAFLLALFPRIPREQEPGQEQEQKQQYFLIVFESGVPAAPRPPANASPASALPDIGGLPVIVQNVVHVPVIPPPRAPPAPAPQRLQVLSRRDQIRGY